MIFKNVSNVKIGLKQSTLENCLPQNSQHIFSPNTRTCANLTKAKNQTNHHLQTPAKNGNLFTAEPTIPSFTREKKVTKRSTARANASQRERKMLVKEHHKAFFGRFSSLARRRVAAALSSLALGARFYVQRAARCRKKTARGDRKIHFLCAGTISMPTAQLRLFFSPSGRKARLLEGGDMVFYSPCCWAIVICGPKEVAIVRCAGLWVDISDSASAWE